MVKSIDPGAIRNDLKTMTVTFDRDLPKKSQRKSAAAKYVAENDIRRVVILVRHHHRAASSAQQRRKVLIENNVFSKYGDGVYFLQRFQRVV